MAKVKNYAVVRAIGEYELERKMEEAIEDGWQPWGSLSVISENEVDWYHQAIVTYEDKK